MCGWEHVPDSEPACLGMKIQTAAACMRVLAGVASNSCHSCMWVLPGLLKALNTASRFLL